MQANLPGSASNARLLGCRPLVCRLAQAAAETHSHPDRAPQQIKYIFYCNGMQCVSHAVMRCAQSWRSLCGRRSVAHEVLLSPMCRARNRFNAHASNQCNIAVQRHAMRGRNAVVTREWSRCGLRSGAKQRAILRAQVRAGWGIPSTRSAACQDARLQPATTIAQLTSHTPTFYLL